MRSAFPCGIESSMSKQAMRRATGVRTGGLIAKRAAFKAAPVALAMTTFAAFGLAYAGAQTDVVENGRIILEKNCARCHAIGAEGESPHKEAPPFRVIVKRYPPDDLAEALAEGLVSGHPDMPEFVFEPDEVGAIVGYLNALLVEESK